MSIPLMISQISTMFLNHKEKLPEMETQQAERDPGENSSVRASGLGRHIGPGYVTEFVKLLHLVCPWPYCM